MIYKLLIYKNNNLLFQQWSKNKYELVEQGIKIGKEHNTGFFILEVEGNKQDD